MQIVPLLEVPRTEWESFVDRCDECWLYHHPAFHEADDPTSRSFGVRIGSRLVGGCVMFVNRSGMGKVLDGRYGASGLALDRGVSRKIYPQLAEHLLQTAHQSGCHAIQMELPRLAPAWEGSGYLDSHLSRLGFSDSRRWGALPYPTPGYTAVLDLLLPREQIWAGFSDSIQRKCRAASCMEFSTHFHQGHTSDDAWSGFLAAHEQTMRRAGGTSLPPPLLAKLRSLVAHRYAALITHEAGGKTIAALLVLTYKHSATAFAIGVEEDGHFEGFGAYVRWAAAGLLKDRGYRRFEIGPFFPAMPPTKLKQLGEFKRKFGGIQLPVLAGELVASEWRHLALAIVPAYCRSLARRLVRSRRQNR
jgi:hypothetical protein